MFEKKTLFFSLLLQEIQSFVRVSPTLRSCGWEGIGNGCVRRKAEAPKSARNAQVLPRSSTGTCCRWGTRNFVLCRRLTACSWARSSPIPSWWLGRVLTPTWPACVASSSHITVWIEMTKSRSTDCRRPWEVFKLNRLQTTLCTSFVW